MKHSAYTFAKEVDSLLEKFSKEDYLLRKDRCKRLREELLPLSRLGLRYKQPGTEVEVEAYENNDAADGTIRISGFYNKVFDVQITHCFNYQQSLRNELLVSQGGCPGAGPINRNKKSKTIEATGVAIDVDSHTQTIANLVFERFLKKSSFAYSSNTILLISFSEVHIRGFNEWQKLFMKLGEKERE